MARFRAMGLSVAEILETPFHALADFEREWWNLKRMENGEQPVAAPGGTSLDVRSLFYGYGMSLGMPVEVCDKEWERQGREGGYGKLPGLGNKG